MQIKKGIMLSEVAFRNIPIILKNCGLDFFIVDNEHGGFDYSDLSGIIMTARLVGIDCIIRLPDNTRRDITKVMDMGATGILIPMTDNAEQIKFAVEYAKYAPVGKRGISTMRAHTLYNPGSLSEYMTRANERTKVFAQIESESGVRNIDEILSVNGVSGVLMGPNDLSCDLNVMQNPEPEILPIIDTVAAAAKKRGKSSGIITGNNRYLKRAKLAGMDYFSVGSELNMLKDGCLSVVKKIEESER